ncbi:DUF6415 family natural product biosynthesis protein [Streptomyces sp. NBC_00203]|uniref:DUF6415 family natural product biosynthesis protein n=1 Tax=Streptomyces sp. NBC_00203 TaxID=2975680 RepID=UPI0032568457
MTAKTALPITPQAMRALTAQVLDEDAELPTAEVLDDLTLLYRGHLMLLIPKVEKAAGGRPESDVAKTGALAGVREARTRLNLVPDRPLPRQVAHAQRLARSVDCLLDHLVNLSGERP